MSVKRKIKFREGSVRGQDCRKGKEARCRGKEG